jgi:hypothetical protein
MAKVPSCPVHLDTERPEEPPAFDRQLTTRRTSAPMEPIPEVHTPRPSVDVRKSSQQLPKLATVEELPPMMQCNAAPTRPPTDPLFLAEESIKTT